MFKIRNRKKKNFLNKQIKHPLSTIVFTVVQQLDNEVVIMYTDVLEKDKTIKYTFDEYEELTKTNGYNYV